MEETKADAPKVTLAGGDDTFAAADGVHPAADVLELGRGDALGRYLVLERIGRGGMGVVYKAFDPQLDRAVAIKLLVSSRAGGTIGRTRLMREAQAMARISHPNVITVYDVGTVEGQVFFTMELVDGLQLGKWVAAQARSSEAILEVFRQAGEGVAAAHAAGVVHRDFKPDNVLIDQSGRVRVLDFGLARRGGDDRPEQRMGSASGSSSLLVDLTTTGEVMGTPAYMAPEQFAGQEADERADQFSFCVALHEALVGKRPFRGESFATLSASVLSGDRNELARVESVPAQIWAVIERGLEGDPARRFSSMRELLAGLRVDPPRRTALWVGIGGVVLCATGLGAYVAVRTTTRAVDPCADVAEGIAQTWNDAARKKLRQGFAAANEVSGATTATRVIARVDDYVASWTAARVEGCLATKVEHTRSAALQAKAVDCLDNAHDRLGELLEGFAEPSEATLQSALSRAWNLPRLYQCTSRSLLEVRISLPDDPTEREEVEALEAKIASARDRIEESGDAAACLEALAEIEDHVRTLKHRATLAHHLSAKATCEWGEGRREAALQTEERAFEAALAASDDFTALRMAAMIAHRVATGTDDFDGAETWLRRAEALAQRHDLELPDQLAAIVNVRGILASRRGHREEALGHFQELERLTRDDPGVTGQHIVALSNIGVAHANSGDFDAALESFEAGAKQAVEYFGEGHLSTAQARAKVAKIHVMRNDYARAEPLQERALETLRAHTAAVDLDLAYELQALTHIKRNLAKDEEALVAVQEAYDIRKALGALDTIEATEMMVVLAHLHREAGRLDEAQSIYEHVMRIRQGETGAPIEVAEVTNFLARTELARGNEDAALALTRKAEALALEAQEDTRRAYRSDVLFGVADVLEMLRDPSCLAAFARAEAVAVQTGREDKVAGGRVGYARAALEAGDEELARALADAAAQTFAQKPYPAKAVTELHEFQAELEAKR